MALILLSLYAYVHQEQSKTEQTGIDDRSIGQIVSYISLALTHALLVVSLLQQLDLKGH